MANPPYDGEDIWGFSSHDTDGGMEITDLRLSSSMGLFMPGQCFDPMESDLQASSSLNMMGIPMVKEEYVEEAPVEPTAPAVVAFETFGALPPPSKKKRRRERDQVMEATIQYGDGAGPHITTPQSSGGRPGGVMGFGGRHPDSNSGEDFFLVEPLPEQQLVPVLPRDHIQPLVDEFVSVREAVVALRAQQYQILTREKNRIEELKEGIRELSVRLDSVEDQFQQLRCAALMHTADVNRMFWLQPELNTCRIQLELYRNEINHTLNPNETWKSTELVLEEHPFPVSLKQKESVPRIVVRLLTGACCNITHVSPIEARVISIAPGSPKPPEISNNVEKVKLNPYHKEQPDANGPTDQGYMAVFENLQFLSGTRMRDFSLVFSCKVSLGHGKSEFSETEPTPPFVVFTNGNQWNDIEGILLKWEAFAGGSNALWCRLANAIQRRYMMATLQNPDEPQRSISRNDFNFLYQTKIDPKSSTLHCQNHAKDLGVPFWSELHTLIHST